MASVLQMYKGVRNNEIIPVTEVAIDAAKQSAIRSFGVQAVYSTRMQTKRRPRLVPAWHRSANITKRIELDNGQVQIVKVPFHERLQLWGRGGLLKALQAIGPVIQADDPQTIQAVANALREKVRHCRPLVRAAVDNYVEWLGAPTQPEGGADEEGGSDEAGVPDEGGAVEGGAEEGGAFEAFPNEGFEYEGGAFEGVADEKGQNEAFAHEGAANEGGSDEGGADGGQVRGGGAPPPEGATPRKRQREEFKGANTERRSKKRGGKPPTLSPRGAGPVVSPPPTTATDGPDSLPSASDTLEVLYGPLGIMNLGPLANGPQSLPTPPSHDGGFREYQDNLPEQPAGEADGGEVLRTARRLLTSLSLQCKGERVGPLRVALAAETLLPSVESLFGIQRDFGVLDVDVSVLERLIGLLTGVRGVLEGPEKNLEGAEAYLTTQAARLESFVETFAPALPMGMLEDPMVQVRLASAHMSLARALSLSGRFDEERIEMAHARSIYASLHSSPPAESLVPSPVCPITRQPMEDPVIIASGHTFERTAIERWAQTGHKTCPVSNQVLDHLDGIPNAAVKSYTDKWHVATGTPLAPAPTWPAVDPAPVETLPKSHDVVDSLRDKTRDEDWQAFLGDILDGVF